jgi:serine/threonine-protein kinase
VVEPGTILGGKYRVGRTLGRGAMGVIVEATHIQLGTLVAVKILRPDYADRAAVAERFLREARAAAQLRGEHICRVHDYGAMDDGTPFMVMELLEGCDLGTLVDQEGPLPPALVANCIVQVCTAIAEPHAHGMVHRDLKPTNLFLQHRSDQTPFIKILDFGIAKFESVDYKLTSTTSVVGSPSYMAPEQLRSNTVIDARTDIWALGVVMYELLTEKQPFVGESMTDLALAITMEPPLPFASQVPNGLADVVMRCLEKNPAQRYQNVAELAEALTPFAQLDARHATAAAHMLAQPRSAMSIVDELIADQAKQTTLRGASGVVLSRPAPRAAVGVGLVLLVAMIAGGILYLRGNDSSNQTKAHRGDPAGDPIDRVHSAGAAKSPTDAASPSPPAPEDAPTDTAEAMQSPSQADAPQDTAPVPSTSIEQRRKKRGPRTTSPDLGNSRL